MENTVDLDLDMYLVLSPERSVRVPARLGYSSSDPFAVHMVFHVGSDFPVRWVFARELLDEGVRRPCGYGDVRIWPTRVRDREVICLALSSPDGNALLEADREEVRRWIRLTHHILPPGEEQRALALDAGLARLLADQ
ncbi:sporulation protein SsgA [Mangrovactinospora gilvigrisea]|uniref:Sporulation protein SsgA n=1 Tax=Mangrovactinospora gilvigrisea TaxID=1428644 RepID=A0A1J7BFE6_9ACTN|nr:sporulation protein SsgA [Mangrovactinospora gilvigrisea]